MEGGIREKEIQKEQIGNEEEAFVEVQEEGDISRRRASKKRDHQSQKNQEILVKVRSVQAYTTPRRGHQNFRI